MTSNSSQLIILLVEDSSDDVFFFSRAVNKTGLAAKVHVAEDGLKAVNYLSGRDDFANRQTFPYPDIIFLDLKMPHMNGFEFLEWFGRAEATRVPVIVLTSSDEPRDRMQAQTLGASLFLTKPPLSEQLIDIFKSALVGNA